ncbi:Bifunctional methylenetetrahydrofolate dehydrogenase/cyclohydrolase, mitochondrial [Characodon lateralis]|uniref:methenyltetrahydrofolate cyclohydrolase n=1 Tax=Characodon lateralis TaxID=208331 RepID=A0ABU7CYH0_9TELE|nr:Bifunctional methylenetetrahydrofolate dehydrogenase/cyclohydrolase, mitochondrial [Characodon lateralis]
MVHSGSVSNIPRDLVKALLEVGVEYIPGQVLCQAFPADPHYALGPAKSVRLSPPPADPAQPFSSPECPKHAAEEAVVISGRKLARQIREETRADVEQWVSTGNRRPHLSVILVGENPASHSYVLNKTRAAADVGISSETILKHSEISEEELLDLIYKLNTDPRVDGLLVQLPLPDHIDERTVCNAVAPNKDVDGFHVVNVGRLCLDQPTMLPATPWGVWEIIKRTGIPTFGKNVVVAGRSKNVGMPIAMLLHTDGRHERPGGDATVTISHRYTPKEQLCQHTKIADIVVAAAGIPNLITADMIKEGAAVIDVGINRVQDPITGKSRLVGDVDFEAVKKKAGFITPVPGGVGPMTVAMLLKNTVKAAKSVLQFPPERIRMAVAS